ncbi:MAG TPA: hypothetical protein VFY73_17740 [Ideonella sp.]|uniref:hypothetical protein n=1 Tax=Ideonella sp. TaxID=1929293 RepID=UPI002E3760A0|nr:hypothetical protein [Ideonella sp.]HEX5685870.1 hypothetical protein [Ideonella sp.]
MESRLFESEPVPAWDAPLMRAVTRLGSSAAQNGMAIGIEDPEGRIYRVVQTNGICETVQFFESARSLGFGIIEGRQIGEQTFQRVLRHHD